MEATIREAQPSDAQALIACVKRLAEEPDIDVPVAPGEFCITVEEEQRLLSDWQAADNCIMLVAEIDGRIVGQLGCRGGTRKASQHVVRLGMSVARGWRNRGIGTALLERAVDWARSTGVVKRIELNVYVRNVGAIHLYEKSGFEIEGRRRRAVCHGGEYVDDYVMALLV